VQGNAIFWGLNFEFGALVDHSFQILVVFVAVLDKPKPVYFEAHGCVTELSNKCRKCLLPHLRNCLSHLLDKIGSLLRLGHKIGDKSIETLLLEVAERAIRLNRLNTARAQHNRSGEKGCLGQVILDEGALANILLAVHGSQQSTSKNLSRVSLQQYRVKLTIRTRAYMLTYHGKSSRSSSILCLDNLITTELDSVGQGSNISIRELGTLDLGQQGKDGGASMTTNHGNIDSSLESGVASGPLVLIDKSVCADNIQSGNSEQSAVVVNTLLLQSLGKDWDGRVDGVGDNEEHSVRATLGASLSESLNNGRIGIE
jgi:hypothetical protein